MDFNRELIKSTLIQQRIWRKSNIPIAADVESMHFYLIWKRFHLYS